MNTDQESGLWTVGEVVAQLAGAPPGATLALRLSEAPDFVGRVDLFGVGAPEPHPDFEHGQVLLQLGIWHRDDGEPDETEGAEAAARGWTAGEFLRGFDGAHPEAVVRIRLVESPDEVGEVSIEGFEAMPPAEGVPAGEAHIVLSVAVAGDLDED